MEEELYYNQIDNLIEEKEINNKVRILQDNIKTLEENRKTYSRSSRGKRES